MDNTNLKKYQNYLKLRGLKNITIKNYLWHVTKFLLWQAKQSPQNISTAKYQRLQLKTKKNIGSLNLHFTILNDYLKFIKNRSQFKLLSRPFIPKKVLSPTELDHFFKVLSNKEDLLAQRDRLLIEVLYYSGLKVSSITQLKLKEIDNVKKEFKTPENTINIDPIVWSHLQKYLKFRHDLNPYLFINHDRSQKSNKEYLSVRSVERIIDKYARQLKPPLVINPQILRHTLAWQIKHNGGQAKDLQKNLNLTSKAATKKYWQVL